MIHRGGKLFETEGKSIAFTKTPRRAPVGLRRPQGLIQLTKKNSDVRLYGRGDMCKGSRTR